MHINQSELDCLNAGKEIKETKKHKYNAAPVVIDGHYFPSKKEGDRYTELKFQEHCNVISDLKIQPRKFVLQEGFKHKSWPKKISQITYTPDFSYIKDGELIYEDTKGVRTAPYVLRRKMLLNRYPDINFIET